MTRTGLRIAARRGFGIESGRKCPRTARTLYGFGRFRLVWATFPNFKAGSGVYSPRLLRHTRAGN